MGDDSQPPRGAGAPGPAAAGTPGGATNAPWSTSDRKTGRELALAVMCAVDSYADEDADGRQQATALTLSRPPRGDADGEGAFAELATSREGRRFAEALLALWTPRRAEFDALIERVSQRWRLARMDSVDRNLLRLAATELSTCPETPRGVVLAEAVRLARRYGAEKSAPFVNGLVESLAQALRPAADASVESSPARQEGSD